MSKKLKLTRIAKSEKKRITGGKMKDDGEVIVCTCGCGYVNCNGSSSSANSVANVELPDHGANTCYGDCC